MRISNRWTAKYESDGLTELEITQRSVVKQLGTIEAEIARLEWSATRLREAEAQNDARGRELVAEIEREEAASQPG
jgi:hypothetical protein